jgi:hypothetical protein
MTRSTYAAPAREDQMPTSDDGWHRTGLTNPSVLAAAVRARLGSWDDEPRYSDFFDPR